MSKPRSKPRDFTVYILVRILICIIQGLSFPACRKLAVGLGWLAYHLNRRHRLVAAENLRLAFPGHYSEAEIDRIVRSVYRHYCTVLMEIAHLPRKFHAHTWRRYMHMNDGRFVRLLLSGRPLLLVTGHFGNWEMGGFTLGTLGFETFAIARPIDNPYIDAFLRRFREARGQKILAKHGEFERIQEVLDQNGILATLADQDAGDRGLFVDFFGRPASTHKAVALLALEYRVPLLVIGVRHTGAPLRYEMLTEDLILPEEYDGQPGATKAITQRFTSALERMVRTAPDQYFWLHRRWKHQPKAKGRAKEKTATEAA